MNSPNIQDVITLVRQLERRVKDFPKSNWTSTVDPTVTDDADKGYSIGSFWYRRGTDSLWICKDATMGAAVWEPTPGTGTFELPADDLGYLHNDGSGLLTWQDVTSWPGLDADYPWTGQHSWTKGLIVGPNTVSILSYGPTDGEALLSLNSIADGDGENWEIFHGVAADSSWFEGSHFDVYGSISNSSMDGTVFDNDHESSLRWRLTVPTIAVPTQECRFYMTVDGVTRVSLNPIPIDAEDAVAHILDTHTELTETGTKLVSFRNAGTEKAYIDKDGNYFPSRFPADAAGFLKNDGAGTLTWEDVTSANPSATIGLSPVNGSAATFMRSDAAPPLSQSIDPEWTGHHRFSNGIFVGPNSETWYGDPLDFSESLVSWREDGVNGDSNYNLIWISVSTGPDISYDHAGFSADGTKTAFRAGVFNKVSGGSHVLDMAVLNTSPYMRLRWAGATLPADQSDDMAGNGSPEGAVVGWPGSTYRRWDGGSGTSFYVKESGTGNTGWVAK